MVILATPPGFRPLHFEAAVKQGASREEVLETMGMAIYMGAGPSVMYAAQALEAFDQFQDSKTSA